MDPAQKIAFTFEPQSGKNPAVLKFGEHKVTVYTHEGAGLPKPLQKFAELWGKLMKRLGFDVEVNNVGSEGKTLYIDKDHLRAGLKELIQEPKVLELLKGHMAAVQKLIHSHPLDAMVAIAKLESGEETPKLQDMQRLIEHEKSSKHKTD